MNQNKRGSIHLPSLFVVILAALFTFGVTVWPGISIDELDLFPNKWWVDVVLHGSYYFLLAVIIFPFFTSRKRKVYWFFPVLFILSVLFEFLQHWQPGRNVSVRDVVGNFLGIAVAALFSYWGRQLTWKAKKRYRDALK